MASIGAANSPVLVGVPAYQKPIMSTTTYTHVEDDGNGAVSNLLYSGAVNISYFAALALGIALIMYLLFLVTGYIAPNVFGVGPWRREDQAGRKTTGGVRSMSEQEMTHLTASVASAIDKK